MGTCIKRTLGFCTPTTPRLQRRRRKKKKRIPTNPYLQIRVRTMTSIPSNENKKKKPLELLEDVFCHVFFFFFSTHSTPPGKLNRFRGTTRVRDRKTQIDWRSRGRGRGRRSKPQIYEDGIVVSSKTSGGRGEQMGLLLRVNHQRLHLEISQQRPMTVT